MIDSVNWPQIACAAFGLGGGAQEGAQQESGAPAGAAIAVELGSEERQLLLLLHADFALFQPGAACECSGAALA